MEATPKHPARRHRQLRVPVRPDEEADIRKQAAAAGLSVAAYLRNIGLGYRVSGIVDCQQVRELARINGDMGRLGGLLKLWLTNDERTARFGEATLRALLARIEATQEEMGRLMLGIVRPRASER